MLDKVKYWFDLADEDLSVGKYLLKGNKLLYTAFMCHQTIEKALKAIISRDCAEGEIPPKIHHLPKLAERAELYSLMSDEQQRFIKELNPYHIEARYPEYKKQMADSLSVEICKEIYAKTEVLLCWIKERL